MITQSTCFTHTHTPLEDCQPYYLKDPWNNGYHVGIEGKVQNPNQGEVPASDVFFNQNIDKILLENNTVYPNPTSGNFTVELTTEWCDATIQIYDNQGKLITTQHNVSHQTIFDVHEFPSGIYLVRIAKDEKAQNIKVIKQ